MRRKSLLASDVYKKVTFLRVGEKNYFYRRKILNRTANFVILDESFYLTKTAFRYII